MALKKAVRIFQALSILSGLLVCPVAVFAQTPVITVRFANPQNDCATQEYCLDVEFKSNTTDQELFGMNVRFFYDDDVLELVDFRDFQGGYGPVAPDPPIISTSTPAGPAMFNFTGAAEFVNGAIQLVNSGPPPIILDTASWSKLFQICFLIDDPFANLDTFCPSVVWDLEQDPANGGFLAGDDGIVITIVDPDPNNESLSADENAVQFNWEYIGSGLPPFGQPVDSVCSNVNCALPLTLLSFKGAAHNEGDFLEWQTNNEINVLGFQVQRRTGQDTWNSIAYLDGTGTSQQITHYSFLDVFPDRGHNYYRLKQMDVDGKFRYSKIVGIYTTNLSTQKQIRVSPNPAGDGKIYISFHQFPVPGNILRILNTSCQIIKEQELGQSGMELDVSDLTPGIYLVWVALGDENMVTRFVVE